MAFTVGLDWGATGQAVGVLDDHGAVIVRLDCPHTRAGPADLLAKSKRVAAPAERPVAIERPSGLLVETLLAAGHPIVPIHPNVVKACRPRHRAAGGKSDPGDAYMLADILRTDGHRFAPLRPISDEIKALLGRDQGSARARPRPRRSGRRPRAARQPVAQSDRRLRGPFPDRGSTRRRGRRRPRQPYFRKEPRRGLPRGMPSPAARCRHLLCRQLPPQLRLGGRGLSARSSPGLRPSPCRPNPDPGLDQGLCSACQNRLPHDPDKHLAAAKIAA